MLSHWWTSVPRHGVVIERVDARLTDLSPGGCRLEMSHALPLGHVAIVEITTTGSRVVEVARVCDSLERAGASSRCVANVQFLPVPISQRESAASAVADSGRRAGRGGAESPALSARRTRGPRRRPR